jgi:hypothetical protein
MSDSLVRPSGAPPGGRRAARPPAAHRSASGTATSRSNVAGLVLPEDTILLRLAPNGVIATRGPLSAADEHMTGYYMVDCDGPERARAIAERTLDRHVLAVELREIHDSSGF